MRVIGGMEQLALDGAAHCVSKRIRVVCAVLKNRYYFCMFDVINNKFLFLISEMITELSPYAPSRPNHPVLIFRKKKSNEICSILPKKSSFKPQKKFNM